MSRRYRPGIRIWLLAAASLALLVGLFGVKWFFVQRIAMLAPAVDAVARADETLQHLGQHVLSMQGTGRGFALTGDAQFERAFDAALRGVQEQLVKLEGEAQLRPDERGPTVSTVPRLRESIAEYVALLRSAMQARITRPDDQEAQERFTTGGEPLSRRVLEHIFELDRLIEADFQRQAHDLIASAERARQIEAALFGLGLLATAAGFVVAEIEMRRRDTVRGALDAANAGLEGKVAERTGELAQSERRWRSLVELSADAILLFGPERTIEYTNPAADRLLRIARVADPLGQPIGVLFAGAGCASVRQELDQLCESGGRLSYVAASLARNDGSALPVQIGAVAYEEAGVRRGQIVIHDLSALHAQQAAAQDQLRFIEQLIEAIPLPLSLRDEAGRFVRVNRAFERAHGRGRAKIIGRSVFDILPYAAAHAMAREDARTVRAGGPIDYEARIAGRDGAAQDLLVRALAMRRDDGSLVGVVALETDVTAMRRKEAELIAVNTELSTMSARLIGAQEEERRRISRELHDQVGQILTALKMQLGSLALRATVDAEALAPLRELADEALRHARDLTASLHPHLLDDLGLEPALRWLLERFIRPTGLEAELRCELAPARGPAAIELVAFRVVQESLTNVVRHAEAAHAEVRLRGRDGRLMIEVRDDGEGFAASDTWFDRQGALSVGVAGMRERVFDAGGEFDIDSALGSGTSVRVVLPW